MIVTRALGFTIACIISSAGASAQEQRVVYLMSCDCTKGFTVERATFK